MLSTGTYDLQTVVGAWAPGHLYPDAFDELLRIMKRGGILVWIRRDAYNDVSPAFAIFDDEVEKRVQQGKWRHLRQPQLVDRYRIGQPGKLYILQKT